MAIETIKQPYEFLARWDQQGKLVGAHVQFRYVTMDGDKVVAEGTPGAEPVALNKGDPGFPLADILDALHVTAVAAFNAASARIETLQSETADLAAQNAELRAVVAKTVAGETAAVDEVNSARPAQ